MAQTQTVGERATTVRKGQDFLSVVYHATEVVHREGKSITLRTGGWKTNTTRTRMNQAANENNLPYRVYQQDFAWFVSLPNGKQVPFDGDEITFELVS